jgi:hypothetical protein
VIVYFSTLTNGIEQGATELLNLIDEKRQHDQMNKYFRQVLFAQSVIVAKVIPLIHLTDLCQLFRLGVIRGCLCKG